ncbi:MAG: phosphohydrolase [Planctomycetes bacterium RBG_16_64_10]|nr:MAG: phosphohydrolase [Planctomycetes bacterium RBG_16_64_10]
MASDPSRAQVLRQLLSGAQLPALPQSAIRVLDLARDPENGPAEYAIPIESEPGLASQVLRFVNSSYFGFAREIASVKLAITLVGIRTIKNFVLWSAVYNMLPNPRCGELDVGKLWQDSLRRGLFARALAKVIGLRDTEGPFAAALLQDMAIPLLAKALPLEYARLLEQRQGGAVRLSTLERDRFGWSHADAAGQIAEQWNLPPEFAVLMERHIHWEKLHEGDAMDPEQVVVTMSCLMPASVDQTWVEQSQFEEIYHERSGPGAPPVGDLLALIDDQFREFAPTLRLSSATRPLVGYCDATASAVR